MNEIWHDFTKYHRGEMVMVRLSENDEWQVRQLYDIWGSIRPIRAINLGDSKIYNWVHIQKLPKGKKNAKKD